MPHQIQSYLTFRVGREWYGITVHSVIEVLHLVALNEVPGTDILGVMTLREQPMKVLDLRRRFGLANLDFKLDTPLIAVNTVHGGVGLVVDEVDNVIQVAEENVTAYSAKFMPGVVRFAGRLLFIVDLEQVLAEGEGGADLIHRNDC